MGELEKCPHCGADAFEQLDDGDVIFGEYFKAWECGDCGYSEIVSPRGDVYTFLSGRLVLLRPNRDGEHIATSCKFCGERMEYDFGEIGIACDSYAHYHCPKCGATAREVYQYVATEWTQAGKDDSNE